MKKSILILSLLFLNLSCQGNKIQELEQKIMLLEKLNNEKQNYIDRKEEVTVVGSQLIGIPKSRDYKVNEKGIINFGFLKYGEIGEYKVYQKNIKSDSLELIYNDLTDSQF